MLSAGREQDCSWKFKTALGERGSITGGLKLHTAFIIQEMTAITYDSLVRTAPFVKVTLPQLGIFPFFQLNPVKSDSIVCVPPLRVMSPSIPLPKSNSLTAD